MGNTINVPVGYVYLYPENGTWYAKPGSVHPIMSQAGGVMRPATTKVTHYCHATDMLSVYTVNWLACGEDPLQLERDIKSGKTTEHAAIVESEYKPKIVYVVGSASPPSGCGHSYHESHHDCH